MKTRLHKKEGGLRKSFFLVVLVFISLVTGALNTLNAQRRVDFYCADSYPFSNYIPDGEIGELVVTINDSLGGNYLEGSTTNLGDNLFTIELSEDLTDSTFNLLDNYSLLKLTFSRTGQDSCYTSHLSYIVDTMTSDSSRLIVRELYVIEHSLFYEQTEFCTEDTVFFSDTSQYMYPTPIDNYLTYIARPEGLNISGNGAISIFDSKPGIYVVEFQKNYTFCVNPEESFQTITITQPDTIIHTDTIYFCQLTGDTSVFEPYTIVGINDVSRDYADLDQNSSDYYQLININADTGLICSSVELIYVDFIVPQITRLTDTIYYCDKSYDFSVFEGYIIEGINNNLNYTDPEFYESIVIKSGYYPAQPTDIIPSFCESGFEIYVEVIESLDIYVEQENLCDKAVLTANAYTDYIEMEWSNGTKGNLIEISGNEPLTVIAVDAHGCKTDYFQEYYFEKISIQSVDYKIQEADCWEDGKVDLISIQARNYNNSFKTRLVNTVSEGYVEDLEAVREGIYDVQIVDDKNCVAYFQEQLLVQQKCMDDYPVFSPDGDGVYDDYFIPYEGIVRIYDRNGLLLKTLNTPAYWDGKDQDGNEMPMGNYVMITDSGKPVNITIIK